MAKSFVDMDFNFFINKSHNIFFKKQGFVIVNLFNKGIIEKLRCVYNNDTPEINKQSYTSFEINNREARKTIDKKIKTIYNQPLLTVLNDYQPLWGNFMVKAPKAQNMELHADWRYVDESEFISMNIWAPLQDTNVKNGTLWVVPKSHKIVKSIRGINLPKYYFKQNELFKKHYGIPVNLKAGQVIFYDHRLVHYSYPNFSNEKRLAATLIIAQKKAEVFYYWFNSQNNNIEKHLVSDPDFFCSTSFTDSPQTKPIALIESNTIKDISAKDIKTHLQKRGFIKSQISNYQLSKFKKLVDFPI